MALNPGTKLSPYEIFEAIAAGVHGEVYKAKDARFNRTVAIKVLPEHLGESPGRKARFDHEPAANAKKR